MKLIIAEDNKEFNNILKQILESNDEIEVIGSCYSDEQELQMIEKLHPEIVITDLVRNGKKTGLEIIKKCKEKSNIPKFLVITAGGDDDIEITSVNNEYLKQNQLKVELLGRGMAWLDTGTYDGLLEASNFIATIEKRQGMYVSCIEEIAFRNGWISKESLLKMAAEYKTEYGRYLEFICSDDN